jgi:hypothetical protein
MTHPLESICHEQCASVQLNKHLRMRQDKARPGLVSSHAGLLLQTQANPGPFGCTCTCAMSETGTDGYEIDSPDALAVGIA